MQNRATGNMTFDNCSGNDKNYGKSDAEDTDAEYDTGQEEAIYTLKNNEKVSTVRSITSLIVSLVSLMTIVIVYCCIGGILFHTLEGPSEILHTFNINQLRNDTVLKLWNITDQFNVLYKENWTSLVSNEIIVFQREIVKAVKDGFDDVILNLPGNEQLLQQQHTSSSITSSLLSVSSHSLTANSPSSVPFATSSSTPVASLLSSLSPTTQIKDNSIDDKLSNQRSRSQWTFAGSFLYSLSLITTTGTFGSDGHTDDGHTDEGVFTRANTGADQRANPRYGNVQARTDQGKIATIIYTSIGIPVMVIYVATVGKLLAKSFQSFYGKFCYCCTCQPTNNGSKGNGAISTDKDKKSLIESTKSSSEVERGDVFTQNSNLLNKNENTLGRTSGKMASVSSDHPNQMNKSTLMSGDSTATYTGETLVYSACDDKQQQQQRQQSHHISPSMLHSSSQLHPQHHQQLHHHPTNYYGRSKYHDQQHSYHLHHTLNRDGDRKSQNDLTMMIKSKSLDRRLLQQQQMHHQQQQQQQQQSSYANGCSNSTSIGGLSSGLPALSVANWSDPSNNPYIASTATITSNNQCNYGTVIDLTSGTGGNLVDPSIGTSGMECGSCEFCIRDAAAHLAHSHEIASSIVGPTVTGNSVTSSLDYSNDAQQQNTISNQATIAIKGKHGHYLEDGVNLHEFNRTNHCQVNTLVNGANLAASHPNGNSSTCGPLHSQVVDSCKVNSDYYQASNTTNGPSASCIECTNDYYQQNSFHSMAGDSKGVTSSTVSGGGSGGVVGNASESNPASGNSGGQAGGAGGYSACTDCYPGVVNQTTSISTSGDLHLNATSLSHAHEMNEHALFTSNIHRTLKRSHNEGNNSENSPCESPHSSSCSVHVPLSVVMLILLTYILIGGVIFSHWHPTWTFLDGCFYSFLTLSTISSSSLSPSNGVNSLPSSSSTTAAANAPAGSSSLSPSSTLNVAYMNNYLTTISPSSHSTSSVHLSSSSPSLSSSLMSSATINNLKNTLTDQNKVTMNNLSQTLLHTNSTGKQIAITVIYLLMGFALISMCFNLVYSDVKSYLMHISRRVDYLFTPSSSNVNSGLKGRRKSRQNNVDSQGNCTIEAVTGSTSTLRNRSSLSRHHHPHQQHLLHQVSRQPLTHSILSSNTPTTALLSSNASVTMRDEIIDS